MHAIVPQTHMDMRAERTHGGRSESGPSSGSPLVSATHQDLHWQCYCPSQGLPLFSEQQSQRETGQWRALGALCPARTTLLPLPPPFAMLCTYRFRFDVESMLMMTLTPVCTVSPLVRGAQAGDVKRLTTQIRSGVAA